MSSRRLVLFGTGMVTRFVRYFIEHETDHEVVALTVDGEHIGEPTAFGLPVVPFEDLQRSHPPDDFSMFVALGYTRVNKLREEKCSEARAMGYELISHVSPRASTWDDLSLGDNCLIMDEVIVHPFVELGSNIMIWSGAHIGHGSSDRGQLLLRLTFAGRRLRHGRAQLLHRGQFDDQARDHHRPREHHRRGCRDHQGHPRTQHLRRAARPSPARVERQASQSVARWPRLGSESWRPTATLGDPTGDLRHAIGSPDLGFQAEGDDEWR